MPRAVHTATLDVSSLALSSTMMSCTVHSPMNSLAQPLCIVVYIVCNPAPRDSPFELSLGLCSNSRVLFLSPSQSPLVWWFVLGLPWVASPMINNKLAVRNRTDDIQWKATPQCDHQQYLHHCVYSQEG